MRWEEAVIMPDHFHALIRMEGGHARLGDVVGGFKAAVSREVHRHITPFTPQLRIWHRNYYEMIVRTADAEKNIRNYIRMNPWKLIISGTHDGLSFRAIGNPNLMNYSKIGVLCSRNIPQGTNLSPPVSDAAFLSGFHSPPEKEILKKLLQSDAKIICCPAWGIDKMRIPAEWLPALRENRMMIMEMNNRDGNLAASTERNRFVLNASNQHWLPHVTPGGMLSRLVRELRIRA